MKNASSVALCIVVLAILASCKAGDTVPPVLKSVQEAKALLPGKVWVVKDVGLKSSFSRSDNEKDVTMGIDWFSTAKEALGEYEKETQSQFANASLELKQDTVAITNGFKITGNQTYVITDEPKEDTPAGIRLQISGGSDDFKDMGIATWTFFVLGASEKSFLLETSSEVNNKKVVLLLEAK